jgi:peptide/nickel transport system ATP-binding protein
MADPGEPDLLAVEDLSVAYLTDAGPIAALNGVTFSIRAGEVFGLVGESGSGKSTLAQSLLRVLGAPAVITGGRVLYRGRDVLGMGEGELRAFRWRHVSLVPQSAMSALSPLHTAGAQIADAIRAHESIDRRALARRVASLLELVGLEPSRADSYPHELSGGMRQRVVIAMALALRPALVVLDESTAALDVVLQQEILGQLAALKHVLGFSVMFVSHDLALTLGNCTRVGVLYAGRLVEVAPAETLRVSPAHPYTRALLACSLDPRRPRGEVRGIPGAPPDPLRLPPGCAYHPRCPAVLDHCRRERPQLVRIGAGRERACHLPGIGP